MPSLLNHPCFYQTADFMQDSGICADKDFRCLCISRSITVGKAIIIPAGPDNIDVYFKFFLSHNISSEVSS
ncbi:hypothetical protein Q4R47_18980, partial [Morganella morganii]